MLQKRELILKTDPSKSLCTSKTCKKILDELGITEGDYSWVVSVRSDNDYRFT